MCGWSRSETTMGADGFMVKDATGRALRFEAALLDVEVVDV